MLDVVSRAVGNVPSAAAFNGCPAARICMLSNLFTPIVSGSATQTLGLARALVQAGHEVVVVTARADYSSLEHEVIDNVHVYRLPAICLPKMGISLNFPWLNWTLSPRNLQRIETILRRHKSEVLHVHNHMFDLALAGAAIKRRLHMPLVLTLHTIIQHQIGAYNLLLYPADRWLLKQLVINYADAIICPDINIDDYLRRRFQRTDGIIIPYGISLPPDPGADVRQAIREHFKLEGKRVILSLGHVHALRNRLDLIRAMPEVVARFPDVLLLIVGEVSDKRAVKLAEDLGVKHHVCFAGPQPYEHISAYHQLAEIEAMWIDQADGGLNSLGVACMEAMCAGRTVLTVSNEDTFGRGVLKNGRDLVIVKKPQHEVAAKITELLSDRALNARIGASARRLALQNFAWPSIAARTTALYRSVAEQIDEPSASASGTELSTEVSAL